MTPRHRSPTSSSAGIRSDTSRWEKNPTAKHAMPEDYAALYLQWAAAIHKVDPKLRLGGPVFEGVNEDIRLWPDARGRTSWMGRFVDYLKVRGRLSDLAFVSFGHCPFEPCDITW